MAKQSAVQRAHTLQLSAIWKLQQVLQANLQNIPHLASKPLKSCTKSSKLATIQCKLDKAVNNLQNMELQLATALYQNKELQAELVSWNNEINLLEKQLE